MKKTAIILILALFVLAACSTQYNTQTPAAQQDNTPAATAPNPAGNLGIKTDIEIKGFAFNPDVVHIPQGSTVIWTNRDSAPHTVTSDSGNELDSNTLSEGQTYAHTFPTAGTYTYHCSIHPSMKGRIVVESPNPV